MTWVHLHLLLNHVPVIGTVIALLLLAVGVLWRNTSVTRTGLALFVLFALVGVVVYLTGEPAEEAVEGLAGVSEPVMERHEEVALLATIVLGAFGAFALGGLVAFRRRNAIPRWYGVLALFLSLIPAGAMGWTANLGGQIRHSEIRSTAAGTAAGNPVAAGEREAGEEHER